MNVRVERESKCARAVDENKKKFDEIMLLVVFCDN